MVTAVTATAATAAGGAGMDPLGGPQLSDLARQALDGLGRMQRDFGVSAAAMRSTPAPAAPAAAAPGQGGTMTASMDAMRASLDAALRVQGQIVQFSMATSISSSMGNNLNSFLKGT